jgi:hypothetical protein
VRAEAAPITCAEVRPPQGGELLPASQQFRGRQPESDAGRERQHSGDADGKRRPAEVDQVDARLLLEVRGQLAEQRDAPLRSAARPAGALVVEPALRVRLDRKGDR